MEMIQIVEVVEGLLGNGVSLDELEGMIEEFLPRENKCDRIFP